MRPVTLHVEGFGVFRSPVEISFDDVDYFALIGPTGAGKSTIIDALCFALYGSIPRYADERLVGRVVSLGAQQAKVSLTFDVSGARYRATRVVRLQKGKTAGDALLERVAGDGSSEVLAKNRSEMKPAMEQLLGLPFAHFTKCVVLPQGEFARFLHDEPAKRRELLVQLLDLDVYSRIGQRARERAKEEGRALELYEHQIDELAFATSEARDRAEQRVDALRELYRAIDAACTDDDADARALAALDERATTAGHRARALAEVRMPERVDEINEAHAHAAATVERAAQVLALATTATEAADAALAGCPDPSVLERARDAHAALAALEPRVREAGAAVDAAAVEVARTEKLLAGARTLADEREAALQSARDAHAAHALAAHLVEGEPCPVCAQTVVETPGRRRRPPVLTKAETAHAEARSLLDAARAAHAATAQGHAAAVATCAGLQSQRDGYLAALAEHPDAGRVAAALSEIDACRVAAAKARAAERDARTAEGEAQALVRSARDQTEQIEDAFGRQRERLLRAGLDPPEPSGGLAGAWSGLATWAAAEHASRVSEQAAARAEHERLVAARAARVDALVVQARACGVAPESGTLPGLRDEIIEQGTRARNELQQIDDAQERTAKLREQSAAARAEHEVARLLGDLLRSDRFEKWLLAEALDVLVDAASRTLYALSQGRFSLRSSTEEEFVIVDHRNADETRSVRTLSGGETFQASLALALALSDQLASLSAAGGVKLDAIFLDEGFGSLDADTLDAVASTIETLGTEGRMVGIVTHVPALAERVPVRFRVHDGTVTREES